jgi:hypothetical protein
MVQVAAIMAQAASTAFPPLWKTVAPAVAARGLPVMAIQFRPCRTGFWVFWAKAFTDRMTVRRRIDFFMYRLICVEEYANFLNYFGDKLI